MSDSPSVEFDVPSFVTPPDLRGLARTDGQPYEPSILNIAFTGTEEPRPSSEHITPMLDLGPGEHSPIIYIQAPQALPVIPDEKSIKTLEDVLSIILRLSQNSYSDKKAEELVSDAKAHAQKLSPQERFELYTGLLDKAFNFEIGTVAKYMSGDDIEARAASSEEKFFDVLAGKPGPIVPIKDVIAQMNAVNSKTKARNFRFDRALKIS